LTISNQTQSAKAQSHATQLIDTGETHQRQGDLNQALAYYQRALALTQEGEQLAQTAACLNHLAEVHQYQGDLIEALS
jgi:hypothetical protein